MYVVHINVETFNFGNARASKESNTEICVRVCAGYVYIKFKYTHIYMFENGHMCQPQFVCNLFINMLDSDADDDEYDDGGGGHDDCDRL